jgi:hypothetical protein
VCAYVNMCVCVCECVCVCVCVCVCAHCIFVFAHAHAPSHAHAHAQGTLATAGPSDLAAIVAPLVSRHAAAADRAHRLTQAAECESISARACVYVHRSLCLDHLLCFVSHPLSPQPPLRPVSSSPLRPCSTRSIQMAVLSLTRCCLPRPRCVCVCACVCVCVCVCERERERECVCVCESVLWARACSFVSPLIT